LIIDEVLAVGDAEFQKKAIGKMQDISRQGVELCFVSHNMAAIKKLCTKDYHDGKQMIVLKVRQMKLSMLQSINMKVIGKLYNEAVADSRIVKFSNGR
jgi:lipopolysaccharide transport system ATP-binding protein